MKKLLCLVAFAFAIAGCEKENTTNSDKSTTFRVLIENVSTTSTLQPGAKLDRTVPLSHGVWAVFTSGSLFTIDQAADEGTSRIAEDGMTTVKTNDLNNSSWVSHNGEFVAPGGPDNGAALFVGESSMFMISAKPGQKLQIQTMFVQSNDWFYSFGDGGLSLFDGNSPLSGDMTSKLVLYDAGTEFDEPAGLGSTQKPDQDPLASNVGPNDVTNLIKVAVTKNPTLVIPPTSSVIRITITPQQ